MEVGLGADIRQLEINNPPTHLAKNCLICLSICVATPSYIASYASSVATRLKTNKNSAQVRWVGYLLRVTLDERALATSISIFDTCKIEILLLRAK